VTPQKEDFQDIWMNRFMARLGGIQPLSTDGAYYGVEFRLPDLGAMDYLAGMAVGDVPAVPDGLVLRDLPAARDAVFRCTVATIRQTFDAIFGHWLPNSPYELDPAAPGVEFYPPDTASADSPVLLHLPIRPKE